MDPRIAINRAKPFKPRRTLSLRSYKLDALNQNLAALKPTIKDRVIDEKSLLLALNIATRRTKKVSISFAKNGTPIFEIEKKGRKEKFNATNYQKLIYWCFSRINIHAPAVFDKAIRSIAYLEKTPKAKKSLQVSMEKATLDLLRYWETCVGADCPKDPLLQPPFSYSDVSLIEKSLIDKPDKTVVSFTCKKTNSIQNEEKRLIFLDELRTMTALFRLGENIPASEPRMEIPNEIILKILQHGDISRFLFTHPESSKSILRMFPENQSLIDTYTSFYQVLFDNKNQRVDLKHRYDKEREIAGYLIMFRGAQSAHGTFSGVDSSAYPNKRISQIYHDVGFKSFVRQLSLRGFTLVNDPSAESELIDTFKAGIRVKFSIPPNSYCDNFHINGSRSLAQAQSLAPENLLSSSLLEIENSLYRIEASEESIIEKLSDLGVKDDALFIGLYPQVRKLFQDTDLKNLVSEVLLVDPSNRTLIACMAYLIETASPEFIKELKLMKSSERPYALLLSAIYTDEWQSVKNEHYTELLPEIYSFINNSRYPERATSKIDVYIYGWSNHPQELKEILRKELEDPAPINNSLIRYIGGITKEIYGIKFPDIDEAKELFHTLYLHGESLVKELYLYLDCSTHNKNSHCDLPFLFGATTAEEVIKYAKAIKKAKEENSQAFSAIFSIIKSIQEKIDPAARFNYEYNLMHSIRQKTLCSYKPATHPFTKPSTLAPHEKLEFLMNVYGKVLSTKYFSPPFISWLLKRLETAKESGVVNYQGRSLIELNKLEAEIAKSLVVEPDTPIPTGVFALLRLTPKPTTEYSIWDEESPVGSDEDLVKQAILFRQLGVYSSDFGGHIDPQMICHIVRAWRIIRLSREELEKLKIIDINKRIHVANSDYPFAPVPAYFQEGKFQAKMYRKSTAELDASVLNSFRTFQELARECNRIIAETKDENSKKVRSTRLESIKQTLIATSKEIKEKSIEHLSSPKSNCSTQTREEIEKQIDSCTTFEKDVNKSKSVKDLFVLISKSRYPSKKIIQKHKPLFRKAILIDHYLESLEKKPSSEYRLPDILTNDSTTYDDKDILSAFYEFFDEFLINDLLPQLASKSTNDGNHIMSVYKKAAKKIFMLRTIEIEFRKIGAKLRESGYEDIAEDVVITPRRGMLAELSGYICNTCRLKDITKHFKPIVAQYPTITFLPFVAKYNSEFPKLEGGALVREVETIDGEKAFILQGISATRQLDSKADPASIFEGLREYLIDTATRAGVNKILLPWNRHILTNRTIKFLPEIRSRYKKENIEFVELKPEFGTYLEFDYTKGCFVIWDAQTEGKA